MGNDEKKNYDVFISYRRNGGEIMARFLYIMLSDKGYSVFYDRVSIKTGRFDETIRKAITSCTDFILVLSPGMFDGKNPKNDEVIKELLIARELGKNIIPLQMDGFRFPDESVYKMPEGLEDFNLINAPQIKIDMFSYEFISNYMKAQKSELDRILTDVLVEADHEQKVFDALNKDVRYNSLRNILRSYMVGDNTDMILNMIKPYISRNYNEKKDFRYSLSINEYLAQLRELPMENMKEKYCRLSERLSFVKKYIKCDGIDAIWVNFDFEDGALDESLRTESVFFSESLKLYPEDVERLKTASPEELQQIYNQIFKVQVAINGEKKDCSELVVGNSGIFAKYAFGEKLREIRFKISFDIPFDLVNNHLYIAISEPTFSPEILIRYDDVYEAEMIPFFDDEMTLKNSGGFEGEYEFSALNNWVMPMSGAVINMKKKR